MTACRAALALLLAAGAVLPAAAKIPDPEKVYEGGAPGLPPGVLVVRDAESFRLAVEPLSPDFGGGATVDLGERTVLRVVGRPRENVCRQTLLTEVSTRMFRAVVRLEERVPAAGCECTAIERPPAAFLVTVARMVRKADVEVTDVVVPCPKTEPVKKAVIEQPMLVLEASWDQPPGARIITGAEDYLKAMTMFGIGERGPQVDFEKQHVVIVTGRARENGCRRTALVAATIAEPGVALFQLEETYPGTGQACTQVFNPAKAFVYRVPLSVAKVQVETKELR